MTWQKAFSQETLNTWSQAITSMMGLVVVSIFGEMITYVPMIEPKHQFNATTRAKAKNQLL